MPSTKAFKYDKENFVFVAACIAAPDDYFFVSHQVAALDKNKYQTHLLRRKNGSWQELATWPWQSVSLAVISLTPLRVEVLGRDGDVGVLNSSKISTENLEPGTALGPMRNLSVISGRVFAYGMQRHIFTRGLKGDWIRFNKGMVDESTDDLDLEAKIKRNIKSDGGINRIVSFSKDQMFAFGMRGEIWHFNKSNWNSVESPSKLMLNDATVDARGKVIACGLRGTVLENKITKFTQLKLESRLGFVSIAAFGGKVFLADGRSLHVLSGEDLKPVGFGVKETVPCFSVVAENGELLAIAGQEAWVSNDGMGWISLLK